MLYTYSNMENQTPQQSLNDPLIPQLQSTIVANQNEDNEVIEQKVRLFQWCLWTSIAVIASLIALLVLTHLFPGGHPPNDPYDQYMTWYAKVQFVMAFLLVPALYGALAWIPIKHLRNGKTVKSKFFIGIIPVGIVSSCIGYLGSGLGHLDCGNGCGSDVPSYQLMLVAFLIALTITTIGPILAVVRLGKLNGIQALVPPEQ